MEDKDHWWDTNKTLEVKRWVLTFLIGIFCSLIAVFVGSVTRILTRSKFRVFKQILEKEKSHLAPFGSAFSVLCAFNVLYVYIAWLTIWIEPLAAGSG